MAISAILNFFKKNLLVLILLGVVAFLLFGKNTPRIQTNRATSSLDMAAAPLMEKSVSSSGVGGLYLPQAAPDNTITDRMVIQNSNLSLKVDDVSQTMEKINQKAQDLSGYMINSSISQPEEKTTGNITVRIPADKMTEFLNYSKGLAVKVVSENLTGYDVTDQYTDTQTQIDTLEKTKAKFEAILSGAAKTQDILEAQREITNIQSQIDSYKGQNKYLEQTSKLAKITIYLASDEFSLPYAPQDSWRPEVIFKTAVRSLVSTLRFLGTAFIWILVFGIIWIPIVLVIYFLNRRKKR